VIRVGRMRRLLYDTGWNRWRINIKRKQRKNKENVGMEGIRQREEKEEKEEKEKNTVIYSLGVKGHIESCI
jgi:hypothetical protein